MLAYAADALVMLVFGDFIAAAFHAYALYRIFGGYRQIANLYVPAPAPSRSAARPGHAT